MREAYTRPHRAYAAIPNACMRDQSLTIEARGTLAYMMTFSDDFRFYADRICDDCGIGRDKYQRIMKELSDAGYVRLRTLRGEGGKVIGSEWVIIDNPKNREPENPVVGDGHREPEEPAAGKSGPIRRSTKEEDQPSFFVSGETQKEDATSKKLPTSSDGELDRHFAEFWSAFPPGRKTDKPKAFDAFRRIVSGKHKSIPKTDAHVIISAAKNFAASKPDPQFTPMPTTWLNGQRWDLYQAARPSPAQEPGSDWWGGRDL